MHDDDEERRSRQREAGVKSLRQTLLFASLCCRLPSQSELFLEPELHPPHVCHTLRHSGREKRPAQRRSEMMRSAFSQPLLSSHKIETGKEEKTFLMPVQSGNRIRSLMKPDGAEERAGRVREMRCGSD
jgi:hypothetical protein